LRNLVGAVNYYTNIKTEGKNVWLYKPPIKIFTKYVPDKMSEAVGIDGSFKASKNFPHIRTKSGVMVGLGETFEEVISVMQDLSSTGCDFITIGQYLRPSKRSLPVVEYVAPRTSAEYKEAALRMGFRGVASAPLVRSSMNTACLVGK
jgi:hypothetical protein